MPVLDEFVAATRRLAIGELAAIDALPVVLTRAAVEVLDVDGASLSLLSENLRMPLGADSAASTAAEKLQFTLGEGPCLDAYREQRPQFFHADQIVSRWPVYAAELRATTPFRSCASFPIDLGDALLGALDLYSVTPEGRSDAGLADLGQVAGHIENELRRRATGASADAGPPWLRSTSMRQRANVWIALALAATTSGLDGVDALTVMRAFAYGTQVTMDELARQIADRELDIRTVLQAPTGRDD